MKCPFCGEDMDHGYINSRTPVFFCSIDSQVDFFEDDKITKYNIKYFSQKAYRCKKCEQIIVDVSNTKGRPNIIKWFGEPLE